MIQYLEHGVFGFCFLDILALIFLVAVIVCGTLRHRHLKDRKREMEDRLSSEMADKIM